MFSWKLENKGIAGAGIDGANSMCMGAENRIGPEGAKALGEGLKENKTLTSLNLWSTSSFRGWIDVCMGADNVWMVADNRVGPEGAKALAPLHDRIRI